MFLIAFVTEVSAECSHFRFTSLHLLFLLLGHSLLIPLASSSPNCSLTFISFRFSCCTVSENVLLPPCVHPYWVRGPLSLGFHSTLLLLLLALMAQSSNCITVIYLGVLSFMLHWKSSLGTETTLSFYPVPSGVSVVNVH